MFERYTEKARRVIFFARYEASQFGSPYIESEHLLLGIVREDKALTNRFLRSEVASIRKQVETQTTIRESTSTSVDLPLSNESKRALAYAAEEAVRHAHKHIGPEHLLLGLLREEQCFAAQILLERGLQLSKVREALALRPHEAAQGQAQIVVHDELSSYTSDLADQTRPLIGREQELDRLVEVLSRFSVTNPVLVGEPGVGKRTIVGGLARRIGDGRVPQSLAEKSILVLDLPPLGVLERDYVSWHERLDRALVAAAEDGKIFFLNRMHDMLGRTSPVDPIHITELIERPIIAGKIQCIATSTPANFAKLRADGHWLAGYFVPIEVAPASEETAIKVLQNIKGVYEKFHNVSFTDDAIEYAVLCASKYAKNRSLPGSAVDVIDEAGAAAQLQQGSLPEEVVEAEKRIRSIVQRLEFSIASHEFEKARSYSQDERKVRDHLRQLREKYKLDDKPVLKIGREEIERAVKKLIGNADDSDSTPS